MSLPPEFIHPNPHTFNSPIRQNFSLPFDVIFNIIKNPSSAEGLKKLQKTCKYFFAKTKIVVTDENIYEHNGFLTYDDYRNIRSRIDYDNNIKLWFNNSLWFGSEKGISKSIYRCILKSLTVTRHTLIMEEINFLLDGGNLKSVTLLSMKILTNEKSNDEICGQILSKLPTPEDFNNRCCQRKNMFSFEDLNKINSINFKSNLNFLYFAYTNYFDPSLLWIVINNNANNNFIIILYIHEKNKENIKVIVEENLQNWNRNIDKPRVLIL